MIDSIVVFFLYAEDGKVGVERSRGLEEGTKGQSPGFPGRFTSPVFSNQHSRQKVMVVRIYHRFLMR
ncbi:hypothetical protein UP91_26825 [Escherichia coli]|nr:hypothetical protein UP91_26825 [Escherichia coli]